MSLVVGYIKDSMVNLAALPLVVIPLNLKNTGKVVAGVAATAISIATLGKIQKVNSFTPWTLYSRSILPNFYIGVISVINPYYNYKYDKKDSIGIITNKIVRPIFEKAVDLVNVDKADSPVNSFFRKHVFSRALFLLAIPVALVTRSADLALGAVAAAFSIIPCLGMAERVNHFAIRELTGLGFISDVCLALLGFVEPGCYRKK